MTLTAPRTPFLDQVTPAARLDSLRAVAASLIRTGHAGPATTLAIETIAEDVLARDPTLLAAAAAEASAAEAEARALGRRHDSHSVFA